MPHHQHLLFISISAQWYNYDSYSSYNSVHTLYIMLSLGFFCYFKKKKKCFTTVYLCLLSLFYLKAYNWMLVTNEIKYKNSISVGNVCFAVSLWTRKWNLSVTVILWIVNIKCAWTKVTNRRYCALCHSSWSFLHLQPWGQHRISALVCSLIDLNTASLRSLKADYRTAHTRAYKLRDRVRVFPGVIPLRLLPSAQTRNEFALCISRNCSRLSSHGLRRDGLRAEDSSGPK